MAALAARAALAAVAVAASPTLARAANVPVAAGAPGPAPLGTVLPLWSTLPFAGILLSIALFPLLAPHFWHRHYPKVSAFWALAFAVPFLVAYRGRAVDEILHIYAIDYVPFIVLLWALFTVSGGIYLGGTLRASPATNVLLLAAGTVLASWVGTTGASMIMIRPVLRANARRRHRAHVVCFFIFLVSNVGGALTPLGDPPLFLGFLHGVPFFWVTRHLVLQTLVLSAVLLGLFWLLDARLLRREPLAIELEETSEKPHLRGARNLLLLASIIGAVLFSGSVRLDEIPLYGHVSVALQDLMRDAALLAIGLVSLWWTPRPVRQRNEFGWGPMREVAYLFAGIFMTIVPALRILEAGESGALAALIRAVREPAHYFWATGVLSSFLDNAPTYLAFFSTALGSVGASESAVPGMLGHVPGVLRHADFARTLEAISAGSVFMGANSYIGNAPNFMVKSIAEEAGIRMPSFFGYMLRYSLLYLMPCFLLLTLLFFRS